MLHGRNRPFARNRGAPGNQPTQAEATSWQAAVIANSGTVSAGRFTIVNNFIAAEKAAGTWALTDDYWGLWAENVPQALTSLKQLRLAVSVSAPNFTADRGYLFDGTVNYLNTGFVPSTMALAATGTNVRLAVYERTNVQGPGNMTAGTAQTTNQAVSICPRTNANGLNGTADCVLSTFIGGGVVLDSRGLSAVSQSAGSVFAAYKNGTLGGTVVPGTTGTTLPNQALFIGANDTTGPVSFRPASVGFACMGASLTAAQEQAQYNNVQAWATAVGGAGMTDYKTIDDLPAGTPNGTDNLEVSQGGVSRRVSLAQIGAATGLLPYLPLAGGTLTGALSGTTATFSGNISAKNTVTVVGPAGVNSGQLRHDDTHVYVMPTNVGGGTVLGAANALAVILTTTQFRPVTTATWDLGGGSFRWKDYYGATGDLTGAIKAQSATAIPAGGAAGVGYLFSSATNFGVFFGSGVPTLSAAKGSLYLRSDGSTTNDRMYVNTNGATTWTAVTTTA